MKSSFRYVRPKTVQMMKNDKNGRTGSVNCFKMHSIRKAETVHETDSTNAELKRRAANGVLKDGTVLIAERQTRGRGRRGRKWENTSGALLMSIACDAEDIAAEDIPLVTLAAALGVLDSLGLLLSSKKRSKADAADVRIKWPNDILFRQKKLCGILAELVKNGTRTMTVIGIGMNVNAAEVSDAWMQRATSLFIETRAVTDVNELGVCIAEHVHERVNMLKQGEKDRILRDYINNCSTLNQEITIHGTDGSKVKAFADGIDEHGRLIAAFPNGETKTVDAADVSVRTAERMPE